MGQWYFFSNDESRSGDIGHEGAFRDTVGCYIHFRANGTMETCEINALGVNSHNLTRSAIEAENSSRCPEAIRLTCCMSEEVMDSLWVVKMALCYGTHT